MCALCNHIGNSQYFRQSRTFFLPRSCLLVRPLVEVLSKAGNEFSWRKKLQNQIKLCKKLPGWMMIIVFTLVRSDMWINMICCTAIGVYVPMSQQNKAYLILAPCPSMKRSFPAWKGKTGGSSSIWKGSHLCPLSVANTLLPIIGKGHLKFVVPSFQNYSLLLV